VIIDFCTATLATDDLPLYPYETTIAEIERIGHPCKEIVQQVNKTRNKNFAACGIALASTLRRRDGISEISDFVEV
jgi:hypothetical protein